MATMQSKSLIWRQVGRFSIAVHSEAPPTDTDWNTVLEEYRATPGALRILVYTEGGAPNPAQRVRLTGVLKGRDVAVAVLSHSMLVRAAGMAIRWFRPELRLFAPSELDAALDYLGANGAERSDVVRVLDDLRSKLGLSKLRTG